MFDYILETTIEDLQFLFGEVRLGFQLIKTLRPVTHHRHLELVICFIYREEKQRIMSRLLQSLLNMCSSRSLEK